MQMKRLLTFMLMVTALIGTVKAQDAPNKTTMLEEHEFAGLGNGATINWNNSNAFTSINGKSYESWIDGEPRFSVENTGRWQIWTSGGTQTTFFQKHDENNADVFNINGLFAGDVVSIQTEGTCTMASSNTSIESDTQLNGETQFTVNSDGTVSINCISRYSGVHKVTIATQHLATYEIVNQTYKFTSGGVLPDKRKAVPYITMSFGNEDMDYAYVRYYGKENNVKQFGSFILTETMDDTYFKDFGTGEDYYQNQTNWDNENGPYVLKEPVVFKGANFSEYVPWHGTYYYFYPETNGKLYIHMHSDPVTSWLDGGTNDVMSLWDKTTNDGNDAQWINYNTEGFYTYGSNAQNGVRVKKNHVYFMCTTPNDARRRNVAHLLDYTFVPDFKMEPLYAVIDPGYEPQTSGEIAVSNLDFTDSNPNLHYRVKKCLGNIASATVNIKNNKLYFTNITYKSGNANKGGAVIVDVDCTDGQADFVLTVPYSAEPIDGTGNEVKKWDFYSNIIDNAVVDYNQIDNTGSTYQPFVTADEPMMGKIHLGQWKTDGSGLRYETEKDPGEWLQTYINLEGDGIEPIFKNVYDIDGDNADMIWDTNGLVFHAESNLTGIYNENDAPSSAFQDRYIGLMKGSEFTIPRLTAGDRIVIKMGTYGNLTDAPEATTLQITNAKDAVGTAISDDYIIGGSAPVSGDVADANGNYVPRGEYHFIAAGGDVTFKVTDGQLLKLYTIQIYKNDDTIVSENELQNSKGNYQIINTTEYTHPDNLTLQPHYRGLNEPTNYVPEHVVVKSGNLQATDIDCSGDPDTYIYTFYVTPLPTAANPKFGVFVARQGVQTTDQAYVTDYADRMIPVGFRETQTYPYTWDFTDLKKYVTIGSGDGADGIDASGNELQVADNDLKIWKNWNMRVKADEWDGNIYASGGQLYGGKTMFEETKGIGITHDNNNVVSMTGDGTDLSGGLSIGNGAYGLIVPQVEKDQVIYVRASKVGNTQQASLEKSNGNPTYTYGQTSENFTYTGTADNGDAIFAYAVTSTKKIDVRLNFKGYEVKKIAVTPYKKTLGDKGWASESRDQAIDHSLTGYFAGQDMHVYVVSDVSYDNRTLTLSDIAASTSTTPILAPVQSTNSDPVAQGCLIYKGSEGKLELVDGGFHLFVPDMHDKDNNALQFSGTNILKAQIDSTKIFAFDGDYTNYVLTYKYYDVDADGKIKPGTTQHQGPEMFYRVSTSGIKLRPNSAYLQLPTSAVKPSTTNPSGHAKFMLIFDGVEDNNVATSIDEIFGNIESGEWYNMSGQKLNGKPQKRGLYIVNGKKVSVK